MAKRRTEDGQQEDYDGGFRHGGIEKRLGDIPKLMPDYGEDMGPSIGITPPQEELPSTGIGPLNPGEVEGGSPGNTERGRDFSPNTPTTSAPQAGGFNLPQGVSVNEGMFSGAPPGNAMQTPAMSMEPDPVAAQPPSPMFAQPESGTMRGPQRRSPQAPAIFAQGGSPGLAGRAGGLMGGGLGATGQGEASGPLSPSDLFQKLMQMFQQG